MDKPLVVPEKYRKALERKRKELAWKEAGLKGCLLELVYLAEAAVLTLGRTINLQNRQVDYSKQLTNERKREKKRRKKYIKFIEKEKVQDKKARKMMRKQYGHDWECYEAFAAIWKWDNYQKNTDTALSDLKFFISSQTCDPEHMSPYNAELQFEVGVAYLSGWLWSIDREQTAKMWFERSAKQNSPRGLMAMGYMYEKGMADCYRDPEQMLSYYTAAAKLGSSPAKYRLAYMAYYWEEDKSKTQKYVIKLLTQAAVDYYPARVMLAKEFPDVAFSSKYIALFASDWDKIANTPLPVVELPGIGTIQKRIDTFYETPYHEYAGLSATSKRKPLPAEGNSSDVSVNNSKYQRSKKTNAVSGHPVETEKPLQTKKSSGAEQQKRTEDRESIDYLGQIIIRRLDKMEMQLAGLEKSSVRIEETTQRTEGVVRENNESLRRVEVSLQMLQTSLNGMWKELRESDAENADKLDELKQMVNNDLQKAASIEYASVTHKAMKDAEKFMEVLFKNDWREPARLCDASCDALVTAHVLMKVADTLGIKNYAGIVITAVWALEHECRRRFYHAFDSYLASINVPEEERPSRMSLKTDKDGNVEFTLGSAYHVVNPFKLKYVWQFVEFSEFDSFANACDFLSLAAKEVQENRHYPDAGMVFWDYWIPGTKKPGNKNTKDTGKSFTQIIYTLNEDYRIPAAHAQEVTKAEAVECCQLLGIMETKKAHKKLDDIEGALKTLLWLTAPLKQS